MRAVALGTPSVVRLRYGETKVSLGPWPAAYVQPVGRDPDDPDATGPDSWWQRSLAARALVAGGPWLLGAVLAVALLGPTHALASFGHSFRQLLFMVNLTPLVRRLVALIAVAPFKRRCLPGS